MSPATRLSLFILWLVVAGCFWAVDAKLTHIEYIEQIEDTGKCSYREDVALHTSNALQMSKEDNIVQADLKFLDLMRRPKVSATIPEDVYEFLSEWAEREQRPMSNLVAYVLTTAVRDIKERQNEQQDGTKKLTTDKKKLPRQ